MKTARDGGKEIAKNDVVLIKYITQCSALVNSCVRLCVCVCVMFILRKYSRLTPTVDQ